MPPHVNQNKPGMSALKWIIILPLQALGLLFGLMMTYEIDNTLGFLISFAILFISVFVLVTGRPVRYIKGRAHALWIGHFSLVMLMVGISSPHDSNIAKVHKPKAVASQPSKASPAREPAASYSEFLYHEPDSKKMVWMLEGKDSIKKRLKDPKSAQFRDLYFSDKMAPVTCGEVNAKNSLGGYTGYERFVTANSPELTFLESDMDRAEFNKVWKEMCGK